MGTGRARISLVALLVAGSWCTGIARADTPPEREARELFKEATRLLETGRFQAALELYEAAYARHPDPRIQVNIGTNQINDTDPDGKAFVKERVELAATQPSFWQSYKFMNPVTHDIAPKEMYCERLEQTVVCGGVYAH